MRKYRFFMIFIIGVILAFIFTPSICFADETNRKLPESVYSMVNTLWEVGLTEDDIKAACSEHKTQDVYCPPKQSLPSGYKLVETPTECHLYRGTESGYSIIKKRDYITAHWIEPMEAFDIESIRRSAQLLFDDIDSGHSRSFVFEGYSKSAMKDAKYRSLVGIQGDIIFGEVTGIYLIAAALRLNDSELALKIYNKIYPLFGSNEKMLEVGLNALAWQKLLGGIEVYQRKDESFYSHTVILFRYTVKYHYPIRRRT